MDSIAADDGFSFIWTIQNYNFCFQKDIDLTSPTFELVEKSNEKWCFKLYPERYFLHDNIGLVLQRSCSGSHREIMLDISIRNVSGLFEKGISSKFDFGSQPGRTVVEMVLKKEEFDTYLNNDALTIKCRMWNLNLKDLESRQCYGRTIIDVKRITYPCTLKGFEGFDKNEGKMIKEQLAILSEIPVFIMVFSSTRDAYAETKVRIEIKQVEQSKKCYSTCEISLIGADRNIVHSVRKEVTFESHGQVWTFPFIQVSKILNNKKLYLPNGLLHLRCEFAISSGVSSNAVERTEYGTGNTDQLQCRNQTTDLTESLKDSLQRLYVEEKLSDLTIRTPNQVFRAHKNILCARSEVFSAMFESDMKEAQTGVVEIDDVDDNTVSKMLLFVYTDSIGEDLDYGTASSLYFAADKYGIVALKRKCSDFLKDNFTLTNVCDVLVLADRHQDEGLKSASQTFIFEQFGELMDSEEWKELLEKNMQLANETMHTVLKKSLIR